MHPDPTAPGWQHQPGIVNIDSPNQGNQAVGERNTLTQHFGTPPTLPEQVTVADLLTALQAVRDDLARLRETGAGALPDDEADEALCSLDRVGDEVVQEEPRPGVIRRHLSFAVDALTSATSLTTAGGTLAASATTLVDSLAKLQAVVLRLFGG
ncbi:hypothetical protein [Streptomyces sp. NPDC048710]|uniref:hypothetical protein n=1 Tax=Streptomyces sp. NPDC048710 TaxID=3365586 RepID=UPI003724B365